MFIIEETQDHSRNNWNKSVGYLSNQFVFETLSLFNEFH